MNDSRIYGEKININQEEVKKFWDNRIYHGNLNSVLLGNQKDDSQSIAKNAKEQDIMSRLLHNINNLSILDIGCGIGRWAKNFLNKRLKFHYTGIDYNENFIKENNKNYSNFPNINFIHMSANNIDFCKLEKKYNLIIISGVLMYINDNNLDEVFKSIFRFSPDYIYIREPVSIINERLTLNNFYSKDLETFYSSIYRLSSDYENLINKYFIDYYVIESEFLYDEKLGAKKETKLNIGLSKTVKNMIIKLFEKKLFVIILQK